MSPGYDREHQQQLHQQGHDAREMMDHSNGIYSTSGAPLQQRGFDLQQASHTNNAADQHGYRPSNSTNYSASMPAGLSHPGAIRIGTSEGTTTLRGRGSDSLEDSRSPSRPRLNQFSTGSYNGGAHAFDQTGWRGPSSVGQTSAFGWEDADREGRTRLREEIQRPWGNERSLSQTSGIGVSNMSPFTRDGGRTLAGLDDGPSMYKARRDYSLGAVGSGRKRSDSAWGGERTLKEADDEDDDALAPPTKSGATSRRHSFAAFNPPSRSTTLGFSLPDENRDPVATIASSFGSSSLRRSGLGSSAIDDDDLAADLNSLHLNLEAHAARVETDEARQQPRYVGSMPTNFPSHISSRTDVITGDDDFRQKSPSLSNSATASQPLKSPPLSSTSALGASRFFSPQQAAPTTSITPSTAERMSSRFEFGSGNVSAAPGHQGVGSLALNDFASGVFGGRQQQHQQQQQQPQQAPNRFVPSFGLPPPSPPASFYSTPFGAPGLNTKSPSFGSFNQQPLPPFSGPPLQQQQQQSFFSSPGPQGRQTSPPGQGQPDLVNLGRGVPLHAVPANAPLYIVEFKAGRKDLFYVEDPNLQLRQGDLVIVEADRGCVLHGSRLRCRRVCRSFAEVQSTLPCRRDVGKYFKPCSLDEVQAFQQRLVEMALGQLASAGQTVGPGGVPLSGPGGAGAAPPNAAALARMTKEFQPKRLYGKAGPADTQMLLSKAQDEVKALALVRNKVAQKSECWGLLSLFRYSELTIVTCRSTDGSL